MKTIYKITLALACGLTSISISQAQELSKKIGDKPTLINASAALEVESTNKGVLISRIALTGTSDTSTIANGNVTSMLVYNTATVADITPGYYYWNGTKWTRVVTPDDMSTLVTNNQTVTTMDNMITGHKIGEYKNEANTVTNINETVTTLVNNGDGTITYKNENGVSTNISLAGAGQTITNLVDNGNGTITYTNENNVAQTVNIVNMVTNNQTVTNLTQSTATGVITYTNENSAPQTAKVISANANNMITAGTDGGAFLSNTVLAPEPWFSAATSGPAISNTERKYSIGDIGIGTAAPNPAAQLDLAKSDKGLLLPRVALTSTTDITTIANPVSGMFIYNTTEDQSANLIKSVYFFDGTRWISPLLSERTGTTPPTPLAFSFNVATEPAGSLVTQQTYVVGPFSPPKSGWYDISFRSYFKASPTASNTIDYNPICWTQISDNSTTVMDSGGVVGDQRFVVAFDYTNTPSYGFKYLVAGTPYYFRYNMTFPPADYSCNSTSINIYLTPFQ